MLSFKDMYEDWNENIRPLIPPNDEPALNESWNNYTDSLGLPDLQYSYCPGVDSDVDLSVMDVDDTLEYIMEQVGFSLEVVGQKGKVTTRLMRDSQCVLEFLDVWDWEDLAREFSNNFDGYPEIVGGADMVMHLIFGDKAKKVQELFEGV